MRKSNDILVGLDVLNLCQFWSSIDDYIFEICKEYPKLENSLLEGLVITMVDNILYQKYYILHNNIHYIYTLSIDKSGKNKKWSFDDNYNYKDIQEEIKQYNHVLDLNYYLKNN